MVFSSSDNYSNEKYDHDVDDDDNYRSNTDVSYRLYINYQLDALTIIYS